jgi:serine/threonine protein kinase
MQDRFMREIVAEFLPDVHIDTIIPYGSGHINKTYKVILDANLNQAYVLQQINHLVFKDVSGVQENISRVTCHIQHRINAIKGSDAPREVIRLIPTRNNLLYFVDKAGKYWRLYNFIDGSRCFQKAPSTDIAMEAGKAFGRFQKYLSDLKGEPLHETIPDFHAVHRRLETFEQALIGDSKNRIRESEPEIAFIREHSKGMKKFIDDAYRNKIPVRITHNDTKLNNILFDENNKAICVIDLDTVMPGFVFYDFGDAIRTLANTADEDEPDITKVSMDMDLYKAFTKGFLSEAGSSLTPGEISGLAYSCLYMTYIIGLRFLTDFLQGDWYFNIHREKHNLERARVQFKLIKDMERRYKEMQEFTQVTKYF